MIQFLVLRNQKKKNNNNNINNSIHPSNRPIT
uniref:Uncharacterized protein n=1 Tax=Rhizophora mucronata TaxID=61149 RepID=A0A2P2K5F5_RHIMU